MVDAKLCEQCRWRGYIDADLCCDYMYITGHARTVLPPREDGGCPVFEAGEREFSGIVQTLLPPTKNVVKRTMVYDEAIMRAAYDNGGTDKEIAEAVGCGKSTVWKWRQFRGLPPNLAPPTEPKFDRVAMMALYKKGYGDKMIARMMGCTHATVFRWREKNDLPPVSMKIWQSTSLLASKMRGLYDQGKNDREIAEAVGCGITSVQRWRHAAGLAAQRWRKNGRDCDG